MTDVKSSSDMFEVMERVREEQDLSTRKLSAMAGASTAFWVSARTNGGNMTTRNMFAVCDALGLKVSITKKGKK